MLSCRRRSHLEVYTLTADGLKVTTLQHMHTLQQPLQTYACALPGCLPHSCSHCIHSSITPVHGSHVWVVLACSNSMLTASVYLPFQSILQVPIYGRISALQLYRPKVGRSAARVAASATGAVHPCSSSRQQQTMQQTMQQTARFALRWLPEPWDDCLVPSCSCDRGLSSRGLLP